jgi:hypothetical protein
MRVWRGEPRSTFVLTGRSRYLACRPGERVMLTPLTRRLRLRAALGLAVLYAFCVLLPHAALALGGALGHCLADLSPAHVHQAPAVAQVHADGAVHTHLKHAEHKHAGDAAKHEPGTDHKSSANCCGLFCLSALAEDMPMKIGPDYVGAALVAEISETRTGCPPGRINRPPIV